MSFIIGDAGITTTIRTAPIRVGDRGFFTPGPHTFRVQRFYVAEVIDVREDGRSLTIEVRDDLNVRIEGVAESDFHAGAEEARGYFSRYALAHGRRCYP